MKNELATFIFVAVAFITSIIELNTVTEKVWRIVWLILGTINAVSLIGLYFTYFY